MLNTASLELGDVSVSVTAPGGAARHTQASTTRYFDEKFERGLFSFAEPLPAGAAARLSLAFKGPLTGDMLGYYRSTGGADGTTAYALTQFEVSGRAVPSALLGPRPRVVFGSAETGR